MYKHILLMAALLWSLCAHSQTAQKKKHDKQTKQKDMFFDRIDTSIFNDSIGAREFTDYDGTKVFQQFIDKETGYYETRLKPNHLFMECRYFHPNGWLESKYLSFWNSHLIIGMHRKYDTLGKLVSEENTDLPYHYNWGWVKQFAIRNKIDLFDKYTKIYRGYDETWKRNVWIIRWDTKQEIERPVKRVILDGKDGEILEETWEYPFSW